MIELGFSLLDYLIKLLERKEDNVDEYFDIYIQPAMEISENVFVDYLGLLHTVKKQIKPGVRKAEIIQILEDGRLKYLPLRRRIYAEVNSRRPKEAVFSNLPRFEKGILGLLMGGLATFETSPKFSTPYGRGHTLLDLILRLHVHYSDATSEEYELLKNERSGEILSESEAERYIMEVLYQIHCLESAFQDVVEGYSQYKALVVTKPARIKKLHRAKRDGD
jgi:hypothetical protein